MLRRASSITEKKWSFRQWFRPLEQPRLQDIKAACSSTDCNAKVPEDINRESHVTASGCGLQLVEQPKLLKKSCTHIPEFDPEKNFVAMPMWLRYDRTKQDGLEKYMYIVCDRPVGNNGTC